MKRTEAAAERKTEMEEKKDINRQLTEWAIELQALAQSGLFYTKNEFDRDRYERIRDIAARMASFQSEVPLEKVKTLFCNETGYQTPKIDTRAAIFKDDKILLVHERNGSWSLPGGWCDVNCSVEENTIKEVREEAGLLATVDLVVAVQDRDRHNPPPYIYKICKIFCLCSVHGGHFEPNLETTETGYFGLDELPELAKEKVNREQIEMCYQAAHSPHWKTLVD